MNEKEAYRAMFYFLENYYQKTKSSEIGGMLGGMSILQDGGTADPAFWEEWKLAFERATKDEHGVKFRLEDK